jgi:hypothetical protein
MENELRYYLNIIKKGLGESEAKRKQAMADMEPAGDIFVPQYIVTAVKLPTGAIELAVNTSNIEQKIDYILEAYDDNMKLKTNPEIEMTNLMIV